MIKFGTDGWRGVIADDFTFENLKIVSQAIALYLKKKKDTPRVVIGYDARFLSREFATICALTLGANKIKVVISQNYVPSPIVSFNSLKGNYDLGIMITASHNPAQFNGLKIKTPQGAAADESLTNEIEKLLYKGKIKSISWEEAKKKGLIEVKEITSCCVNFLKGFVNLKKIRKLKLKLLVDVMYGAGDKFIEKVISPSFFKIDYLHNEFNPSFGGIHPEPTSNNLKELIEKVKKYNYDLGVALDGDGDRLAVVTPKIGFIDAQVLLPLLAIHVIKNRKEKGGIGKTVVGSNLIDEVALSLGVECYETKVGFKHISNLFQKGLICIGGEEAGGIGLKRYIPERDGTASFLLLLEMMAYEEKDLESLLKELWKKYGRWYYQRTSISLKDMKRKSLGKLKIPHHLLGKKVERVNTLDGIKLITKDTWLMLRKSGTEPIIRIYAEAKTKKETTSLLNLGKELVYAL